MPHSAIRRIVYRNPNGNQHRAHHRSLIRHGRACATHLAACGVRVYGTSRVAPAPVAYTMLQVDVTEDASIQRAVDTILQREGHLDIVVNNAGIAIAGPWNSRPSRKPSGNST
jgi:NAD(P)-dependent dehydrogenase (short-subunit alcohol dehydrogenase family)